MNESEINKTDSKEIWVCDITEQSSMQFHEDIMSKFEEHPYKPIIININSYGGDVDALFSMLDSLDSVRSMAPPEFKFLTVTKGKACSAGAVLLSYGDYRFATSLSRIMIHQVVGGTWGSQPSNKVEFEEMSRMNDKLLQILKKRCKLTISIKEFRERLSHNLYLTPAEAKEFGLIDIIGYPKLTEKMYYEIVVVNGEEPSANRRTNSKAPKTKGKN